MKTGEIIKTHRLRLGLSQRELGDKVGVNKAAVQKWESGVVQNIKKSIIQQLSEIFNITPNELLGFERTPTKEDFSKWDEKYNPAGKLPKEVNEFEDFIKFLKSIGYVVELTHMDDGYEVDISKNGITTEFSKEEFENFQMETKKSVDYQVWLKF